MVYDVSLLHVLSLLWLKIFIFVSFKMNTVLKKLHRFQKQAHTHPCPPLSPEFSFLEVVVFDASSV